jgi:hypothetical protein
MLNRLTFTKYYFNINQKKKIMKKVLFVMVIFMSALIVNAQQDTCKTTAKMKSPATTMSNDKAIRTAVKVTDLQKAITDNVARDYAGFTIKEASSVSLENIITYEVVIVKGTATETLVYDKDGNFVEKLALNDLIIK